MSAPGPESFYDGLAPFYHLLYGDWDAAIERQGAALAGVLADAGVAAGAPVLDAACGIGTQTLGLARHDYRMHASDVSTGALARLRDELARRKLTADIREDDLRTLARTTPGSMAAVIACDNSIPHLLSDADILRAFESCRRCLKVGGIGVFSVRDYAAIERRSPDVRPYGLRVENGERFLGVQVWEWEGDQYDLRLYLTSESASGECRTRVLRSRYYAVSIATLMTLMGVAGFIDVTRRDDVLFQPVLLGRRADG